MGKTLSSNSITGRYPLGSQQEISIGDGVNSSGSYNVTNFASFNACLNAALADIVGNGRIRILSGTYALNANIVLSRSCSIESDQAIIDTGANSVTTSVTTLDQDIYEIVTPNATEDLGSIYSDGTTLFFAWTDNTTGDQSLYLRRSTDAGATWGSTITVDATAATDFLHASVHASGTKVYIAYRDETNQTLKLAKSTTSGDSGTWTTQTVDSFGDVGKIPKLQVLYDTPDIVYISYHDSSYNDLRVAISLDGGTTWTFPARTYPIITAVPDNIMVTTNTVKDAFATDNGAYLLSSNGAGGVFHYSSDNGDTWYTGVDINPTPTVFSTIHASMVVGTVGANDIAYVAAYEDVMDRELFISSAYGSPVNEASVWNEQLVDATESDTGKGNSITAIYDRYTLLAGGTASGVFTIGETVSQPVSLATGTVVAQSAVDTPILGAPEKLVISVTSGTFIKDQVVTGGTSTNTFTPTVVTFSNAVYCCYWRLATTSWYVARCVNSNPVIYPDEDIYDIQEIHDAAGSAADTVSNIVAYYDGTNDYVHAAVWDSSGGFYSVTSDDGGVTWDAGVSIGNATSGAAGGADLNANIDITADEVGSVYITSIAGTAGEELQIWKSINYGATWGSAVEVDGTDNIRGNKISIDANGIYITYCRINNNENVIASSMDAGATWRTKVLNEQIGQTTTNYVRNSLLFSFFHGITGNGGIYLRRVLVPLVFDNENVAIYTSLHVPDTNRIFLSYINTDTNDLKLVRSTDAGVTWLANQTLDATNIQSQQSSMDSNGTGYVYISYYDTGNQTLRLATSDDYGVTWVTSLVDNTADVGKYSNVKADGSNVYVSYFDETNDKVKATSSENNGVTWGIIVESNSGTTNSPISMAFDSPRIFVAYKSSGDYLVSSILVPLDSLLDLTKIFEIIGLDISTTGGTACFTFGALNSPVSVLLKNCKFSGDGIDIVKTDVTDLVVKNCSSETTTSNL